MMKIKLEDLNEALAGNAPHEVEEKMSRLAELLREGVTVPTQLEAFARGHATGTLQAETL